MLAFVALELGDRDEERGLDRVVDVGGIERQRRELVVVDIERELEAAEQAILRLRDRDDADWAAWMQQAHQRRYTAPRIERILDVEFASP